MGNNPTNPLRIELLRGSLQIARPLFPSIDILVFHEDFTEDEFAQLPQVTKFIKTDFTGYEHLRNPAMRRQYGYLMMCRFFSGVMQNHPEVAKYTHHMRLDDDSYFMQPHITEERVLKELIKHDYVYRSLFIDIQDQQSLWEFTIEFLRKEGLGAHIETLKNELRKKGFLTGNTYTGLAPYNNFHIASQRLWQNPLIQRYVQAIEESHGILQKGWMDANIHAMIIYALTLFIGMKIHGEFSFGYRHNIHVSNMNSRWVTFNPQLPYTAT